MNQEKEEIVLRFENEYDFDEVVEELYYIFHNSYNKPSSIEEAKQILLQFLED